MQQRGQPFQQRGRRHRAGLQPIPPGECQHAAGDAGPALGRLQRRAGVAADPPGIVRPAFQQPQRAGHHLQQVVEIMRDAAGDAAERLQLLRLAQPRFGADALGHVEHHGVAAEEAARGIAFGPGPQQDIDDRAVAADHAVLHLAHLVTALPQLGEGGFPAVPAGRVHEVRGAAPQHLVPAIAEEGQPFGADLDQLAGGIDQVEGGRGAVIDPPQLRLALGQGRGALGDPLFQLLIRPPQHRLGPLAIRKVEDEGDGFVPSHIEQGEADRTGIRLPSGRMYSFS